MFDTTHLHPMLVHFPIALVMFGFIAEVAGLIFKKEVCLTKTGFYLLIIGTFAAIVTWLSGILFTNEMSSTAGLVKSTHELFALLTVGLLLITSILRIMLMLKKSEKLNLKWIALALYALACLSVSITGFYGGTLVYTYMMPL